jgi:hypothetical protein
VAIVKTLLENVRLIDLPFIDVWNLIQVLPEALPIVWTDRNFRERVEFEFNDVYRASLDAAGEMQLSLRDELLAMSSKSATRLYRGLSDTVMPWALLYQRCRRLTVLSKRLDEKEVVTSIQTWASLDVEQFGPMFPVNVVSERDAKGNGQYLAIPVFRWTAAEIYYFIVINWTSVPTRRDPAAHAAGLFTPHVVLDVRTVTIAGARTERPARTDFVITQTGKVVYTVWHPSGHYLEAYDSLTKRRIPGDDPDRIAKAIEFITGSAEHEDRNIQSLGVINNSSVVRLTLSPAAIRDIDIETYVDYLEDKRGNVEFVTVPRHGYPRTEGFYLQNSWRLVGVPKQPQKATHLILEKHGKPAPGTDPLTPEHINHALGPFFSISRRDPVVYAGYVGARYGLFSPGGRSVIDKSSWHFEIAIQSSCFVIEHGMEEVSDPSSTGIVVYHPAQFAVRVRFLEKFANGRIPILLAMVGSKLLVHYYIRNGYRDNETSLHILDLEELFIANVDSFPKLIRAPCRSCSLPSVAHCAGKGCGMPYCGQDCQKDNWSAHQLECNDH